MRLLMCVLSIVLLLNGTAVDLPNEILLHYENSSFSSESNALTLSTENYFVQQTSTLHTTAVQTDIITHFNNFKWENTP